MLTIESPVAQWLERPTRSRRVVGSNPIWNSDFFSESPLDAKTSCGIKTGRKKVAFSGDGRINRFDQSTWVVCCGGQETEGRNEMQMNKELKAKCVPVRASRFYTRRI